MLLWTQCSFMITLLLGTYYVVITEDATAINWYKIVLIGFIGGSVIVLPLQHILGSPEIAATPPTAVTTESLQYHISTSQEAIQNDTATNNTEKLLGRSPCSRG